jgi:cell division protein FtsB
MLLTKLNGINMEEIIFILSFILVSLAITLYISLYILSSVSKKNELLEQELKEQIEINDSLKKEIKFQSNVNKTLREGLDAITQKNCHVKDI